MEKNGRGERRGAAGQADHPGRRGQVRRGLHLQRAGSLRPARRAGQHHGRRLLPHLLRRRPVRHPAEGAADQSLRLRLRLLRQSPLQRPAEGRLHPPGAGGAHHRLLPAQLHRGAVPLLRRVGRPRPHHRGHDRDPPAPAGGVRLLWLHPRQGHPRGRPPAHPAAGDAGRPAERQHRAAQRGQPQPPVSRQGKGGHPGPHGPDPGRHPGEPRRAGKIPPRPPGLPRRASPPR